MFKKIRAILKARKNLRHFTKMLKSIDGNEFVKIIDEFMEQKNKNNENIF